jgi:hypothetical protein
MGAVPNSFMQNVLSQIRAPVTAVNIRNLQTWQRFEGGTAVNNPLNDTDEAPGSTPYNQAGVQNYPNAAIGERLTAETLMNGRYTAILVKLRHSAPLSQWNDPSVLEQIRTWGSVGFAAFIETQKPTPPPPVPPIPIPKEHERMLLIAFPNGTVYHLGGDFMIALANGAEEQLYLDAGIPKVTVTQATADRYLARFPAVPA